jgi:hypothetical protein
LSATLRGCVARKDATMSATTVFLGKLIDLYLVAISVGMLANRSRTIATLDEMARSAVDAILRNGRDVGWPCGHARPPGLERRGAAGRRHSHGWAALLKGVMLLLVPGERIAAAYKGVGFERFFHAWMIVVLALGLWVTWMAFTV